jgi:hypothetical protein
VPSLAAAVGNGRAAHPGEEAEILDVGCVHQMVNEGEDEDGDGGAGLGPRGRGTDLRRSPARLRLQIALGDTRGTGPRQCCGISAKRVGLPLCSAPTWAAALGLGPCLLGSLLTTNVMHARSLLIKSSIFIARVLCNV